jgi:hypothetical protein
MRGEPHIAKTLHVLHKPIKQRDAAAVADHMRVHGQQEQAAFAIGAIEFGGEHLLHA